MLIIEFRKRYIELLKERYLISSRWSELNVKKVDKIDKINKKLKKLRDEYGLRYKTITFPTQVEILEIIALIILKAYEIQEKSYTSKTKFKCQQITFHSCLEQAFNFYNFPREFFRLIELTSHALSDWADDILSCSTFETRHPKL